MSLQFPDSFWQQTATDLAPNPELLEAIDVDVVVVGAGFTGLRAALELAIKGVQVAVIDAGDVGWGASGRTGGQVNPMLPFNSPEQIKNTVGMQYFDKLTDVSLNSADELFAFISEHNIDCQARQKGWLRVDHSLKAQREARANAEIWNSFGAEMIPVEQDDIYKLSGSRAYCSGIVAPKGGAVQPLSLARGLAREALARGTKIFANSRVTSLEETASGWQLETAKAHINASWVILATNGYTDSLLGGLEGSIIPLLPVQIATAALDEKQVGPILPEGHTISDTRRVIMYSRREPGNQIVFGGHGKPKPNGEFGGFKWLEQDAERIFPSLRGVQWEYRWGGNIALTSDHLPHLHEPRKGLLAGLGYNGRGVAMSNVIGRIMAERVLGATSESLPLPTTDITKYPFRTAAMMGKGTAINWMRFLDYLETR